MLYFAYGSNLHHFQMKRRCKDSIFLKKINLKDFRLTFRSKYRAADIQPKKNSIVPGALFEISKSDENKLDIYHTPYYLNDGGNFPVYKCGTCKVNIDKLENELVNGDEEEIYYMVPKNILTEIYGTAIECHDYYPDSEE